MDSHSYRNVHDENQYTRIWIVIRTNMYMTKTHKDMDSHSYKHVHDETHKNMDSHSYKDVHDENQYKNIC